MLCKIVLDGVYHVAPQYMSTFQMYYKSNTHKTQTCSQNSSEGHRSIKMRHRKIYKIQWDTKRS